MSVARLRVNVEHKTDVDLACRWKLRMFIENNSGAGTAKDKWEEITLYGNGNAEVPSIRDLEVRVNNNCGTPLDTGFRSFTDVNEVLEGYECGIGIETFKEYKEKDLIEVYELKQVKRKLK